MAAVVEGGVLLTQMMSPASIGDVTDQSGAGGLPSSLSRVHIFRKMLWRIKTRTISRDITRQQQRSRVLVL